MTFGISFDFWNTLYANGDESRRHQMRVSFFYKILSNYINTDLASVENVFEWSRQFFIQNWLKKQITPTAEIRVCQMAEKLGVTLDPSDTKKIVLYFGNIIRQVPPLRIADLKICVAELSIRYPLAIISDTGYISGKFIRRFLKDEQILSFFKSCVFSDEQKHSKPHSSVFELTCQNLQIDRSRLIHIGDLEQTDILGIRAFGGISIKYSGVAGNHDEKTAADHVLMNYKKLPLLIADLTGHPL